MKAAAGPREVVLPPPDLSLIDTLGEGADPDRPVRIKAAAGPRDEGLREAAQRLSDHLFEIYDHHIDREYLWEADWKALRAALAKASE